MTRYPLDTDGVIDYLFGIPSTASFIHGLYDQGSELCTCAVVLTELYSGLRPQHQEAAEDFLASLTFLQASPTASRQAGQWRLAYRRQDLQLATTDCLIAATALNHYAHLVTANVADFPMPELTVAPLPRSSGRAR